MGGGHGLQAQYALALSSAADELSACRDADSLLRLATQLVRERMGLERVAFYMRDHRAGRAIIRGTWGTDMRGEISDEHALFHELAKSDVDMLVGLRTTGTFGVYQERAQRFSMQDGKSAMIGEGWLMTTPIVSGGELLGVMYNDSALTESSIDPLAQATAAVFCTLLAILYLSRRGTIPWQPLPVESGHSPLVERVVHAIHRDLPARGERLARELGVSPGHLARSFKREMGVSLVDYRNRLRIDRFFEAVHRSGRSGNLLEAALEAGFGSYAQFHRIYRKFVGTTPRRILYDGQPPREPLALPPQHRAAADVAGGQGAVPQNANGSSSSH
jgi:AraC-like DNA-binding protein